MSAVGVSINDLKNNNWAMTSNEENVFQPLSLLLHYSGAKNRESPVFSPQVCPIPNTACKMKRQLNHFIDITMLDAFVDNSKKMS